MVPLFRASALEVRLCGGSIYPLSINMDGWMWRDDRVMKSNKRASQRGEVTSGSVLVKKSAHIQTLQSANSIRQRGDEKLKGVSKWNNHYLNVEGCCRSQY